MILFNAGFSDIRMWETTIGWLSEIARVTVFDHRDAGLSSFGEQPYSEIEDVRAVLDAAGVRSAVLVGVSDGGRRALAFAHRYPDRVDRVIPVGATFGDFPDPNAEELASRDEITELLARLERLYATGGIRARAAGDIDAWASRVSEHDRRKLIGMECANSRLILLEDYLGSELDPPVKTRLHEITVPVSVLVGGFDLTSTRLWADRILAQAPDATLTRLPGADHFPMLSTPKEFEAFLRAELAYAG